MNRKKILAGNWKMNTNLHESIALTKNLKSETKNFAEVEKIIFPPFPFLKSIVDELIAETNFFVGAQNCSEFDKGAYTGEVSAQMLASVGCNFVLIGHSERRLLFKETNEQLILKINQALKNNLKIIFCFGEKLEERQNQKHFETIKQQLESVFKNYNETQINSFYLAYEPVWAIGTGQTATPNQAQEIHLFVRDVMAGMFSISVSKKIPILYGGSCNATNAAELFLMPDVDGGLIGGASLNASDFGKIITSF